MKYTDKQIEELYSRPDIISGLAKLKSELDKELNTQVELSIDFEPLPQTLKQKYVISAETDWKDIEEGEPHFVDRIGASIRLLVPVANIDKTAKFSIEADDLLYSNECNIENFLFSGVFVAFKKAIRDPENYFA